MRSFVVILLLSLTSIASAHPMGNFSINHYSALSLAEKGVKIEYIIDLAEIPTFQEMETFDLNHDKQISVEEGERFARFKATEFTRNLTLSIDGKILRLRPVRNSLHVVPGAGGLPTLVIRTDYFADLEGGMLSEKHSVVYKDENFPDRIGWKEIVIRKGNSISFSDATQAHVDRSKELTEYPQDQR